MKKVVIVSDLHCGHRAGLTPPEWQYSELSSSETRKQFASMQKMIWQWYMSRVQAIGQPDLLICNGDAIDGKGKRSGGSEIFEGDLMHQAEIATFCLQQWQAKKIMMTYGTPYHTGEGEDFELVIADQLNAEIKSHLFIDVEGVILDVKHKIGGSSIPHGRHTAINREALWNMIWADRDIQPNADIVIRSHVHYYTYSENIGKACITTPALQGFGSKYGSRQCSGTVDIGLIELNIEGKNEWTKTLHTLQGEFLRDDILKA